MDRLEHRFHRYAEAGFAFGCVHAQQIDRRDGVDRHRVAAGEVDHPAKVVGQVGETGDGQARVLFTGDGLGDAVKHKQHRPRLSAHKKRAAGGVGGAFLVASTIRQEEVAQLARLGDLPDVEGDAAGRMHELPGIEVFGRHVFGQLRLTFVEHLRAPRDEDVHQDKVQRRHHRAEIKNGTGKAEGREAGGLHDDEFAFLRQPVGDIDRRDKGGNRQHKPDHIGQHQQREFEEDKRGMPIAQQAIEQAHGPVDPVDRHKDKRKEAEQRDQLRQQISVES